MEATGQAKELKDYKGKALAFGIKKDLINNGRYSTKRK